MTKFFILHRARSGHSWEVTSFTTDPNVHVQAIGSTVRRGVPGDYVVIGGVTVEFRIEESQ